MALLLDYKPRREWDDHENPVGNWILCALVEALFALLILLIGLYL